MRSIGRDPIFAERAEGAELFGWEERMKLNGRRNGSKVTAVAVGGSTWEGAGRIWYDALLAVTAHDPDLPAGDDDAPDVLALGVGRPRAVLL